MLTRGSVCLALAFPSEKGKLQVKTRSNFAQIVHLNFVLKKSSISAGNRTNVAESHRTGHPGASVFHGLSPVLENGSDCPSSLSLCPSCHPKIQARAEVSGAQEAPCCHSSAFRLWLPVDGGISHKQGFPTNSVSFFLHLFLAKGPAPTLNIFPHLPIASHFGQFPSTTPLSFLPQHDGVLH